jgi:hypothetical protein
MVPEPGGLSRQTEQKEGITMDRGKNKEKVLAQQLGAGITKHFSNASSLTFGNSTFTPAQIEASLQTLVDLRTAVEDARAALQAKVAAENAQSAPLRSQLSALVAFVKVTFGNTPDVLADFGLKPNKVRTPLTLDQKAAASAKRAATRAARHTMGSKQKKEVKGTITTIVTSPTTPAAPPVAPSPVASALNLDAIPRAR